jgi:hypothetical protein
MPAADSATFTDPSEYYKALETRFSEAVAAYSAHILDPSTVNPSNGELTKLRDAMNEVTQEVFAFREHEWKRRRLLNQMQQSADH